MKTKKILMITAVVLAVLGTALQAKAQVKKELDTDCFSAIEVGNMFKVNLIKADACKVVYEGDEAMVNSLQIEVHDDKLELSYDGNGRTGFNGKGEIEVDVYYVSLDEIEVSGAAKLFTRDPIRGKSLELEVSGAAELDIQVEVERLYSEFSGASNVRLSGSAGSHALEASGASNVKAYNLVTQETEALVSGAAMAYVHAGKKLTGSVSGVAKLKYDDEPEEVDINKSQTVEKRIQKEINRAHRNEDSVRVRVGKFDVQVIDSDTTTITMGRSTIRIDDDGNVDIGRSKKEPSFDGHWAGFNLGVNGLMDSDQELNMPAGYEKLDLTYEKSINVQVNFYEQNINLIRNHVGLVTGLGLMWDNYRFDDNVILSNSADTLGFETPAPDRIYKKSKLVATYLTLPVLLEFQTDSDNDINSFHLSAGVVGGLRIGTHTKTVYNGNNKNKEREAFYLNSFRGDALVTIGWGKLNLYASYSLVPLFKDGKGPELYPFNVGLQLLNF
jgi:hypothetical protein